MIDVVGRPSSLRGGTNRSCPRCTIRAASIESSGVRVRQRGAEDRLVRQGEARVEHVEVPGVERPVVRLDHRHRRHVELGEVTGRAWPSARSPTGCRRGARRPSGRTAARSTHGKTMFRPPRTTECSRVAGAQVELARGLARPSRGRTRGREWTTPSSTFCPAARNSSSASSWQELDADLADEPLPAPLDRLEALGREDLVVGHVVAEHVGSSSRRRAPAPWSGAGEPAVNMWCMKHHYVMGRRFPEQRGSPTAGSAAPAQARGVVRAVRDDRRRGADADDVHLERRCRARRGRRPGRPAPDCARHCARTRPTSRTRRAAAPTRPARTAPASASVAADVERDEALRGPAVALPQRGVPADEGAACRTRRTGPGRSCPACTPR